MKPETQFQHALQKKLQENGIQAKPTEVISQPGFPDTSIFYNNKCYFIECKIKSKKMFWDHFQPTQKPKYRELFKQGNKNIFVAFKTGRGQCTIVRLTERSLDMNTSFEYFILDQVDFIVDATYQEACEFLKSFIIGDCKSCRWNDSTPCLECNENLKNWESCK